MLYDENTAIKDVVAEWDRGGTVWSIEMGGLGPGYEQAIQVLIIELLRDNTEKPLPGEVKPANSRLTGERREADLRRLAEEAAAWDNWGNDTVHRIDEACHGFSGAQVGAAKTVAFRMLKEGYGKTLASMKRRGASRVIQISNVWPKVVTP